MKKPTIKKKNKEDHIFCCARCGYTSKHLKKCLNCKIAMDKFCKKCGNAKSNCAYIKC